MLARNHIIAGHALSDMISVDEAITPRTVPGNSEAERFDKAVGKMFSVSKEDLLRKEAKLKLARTRGKRRPVRPAGSSAFGQLGARAR